MKASARNLRQGKVVCIGFVVTIVVTILHPVVVSQADNSASTTFKVTSTLFSSLSTKSQSNVSSFEAPGNKSNATLPIVNNNSLSDNAESDHTIRVENNSPTANTSSIMEAENTSSTPTSNKMNNTSVTDFTDNKINENHVSSTSSEINDTSNIKKSSEKNSPINPLKSNDQPAPVELPKDNTNQETAQNESNKPISDAKVKNNETSHMDSSQSIQNSVTEKSSSVREHKTITKVTRADSDNQPERQSVSADSIKRDRALFFKYLNSNKDNVNEEHKTEVNNRPVAINDQATTESSIPVKINILSNNKDPDGDKLNVMGVSRPARGTIESDADGTIIYSPLKSWSGTERFGYTISDGRGGVATGTVTVIIQNHPPEAVDQDVSVNANSPIKIKLDAKDPDDIFGQKLLIRLRSGTF